MPADSPERNLRTKKFQQINDAYYTLSDPVRRRDYDATRSYHFPGTGGSRNDYTAADPDEEEIPRTDAGANGGGGFGFGSFPWSAFGFGGKAKSEEDANKFSNDQFGGIFEEMLR